MTRRLWRDMPLDEERVVLGEPKNGSALRYAGASQLAGGPQSAVMSHLAGSPQSGSMSHLAGAPQSGSMSHLAGAPQSGGMSQLTGAPQPGGVSQFAGASQSAGAAHSPGLSPSSSHLLPAASHASLREDLQLAQSQIAELELALQTAQRDAQEKASELTELRAGIEAERGAAREQGYAAGLERATAAAKVEAESHARHWQQTSEELLRAHDTRWQTLRNELTDVVMGSVIKVLGEQLAHPHVVRAAVEQAMRESGISTPPRVLIAPAQYEQLMKAGGAILAWFKERRMELAPDPRVTHGGCLLETSGGWIDTRFETQLAKLREIVAAHYGGALR